MTSGLPTPVPPADNVTTLTLISNARRNLVEARTLPDVQRVIEAATLLVDAAQRAARLAEAQRVAADIVNAAIGAANDAAAIRIEAQARAGEILHRLREDGQIAGQGRPQKRSTASTFPSARAARRPRRWTTSASARTTRPSGSGSRPCPWTSDGTTSSRPRPPGA